MKVKVLMATLGVKPEPVTVIEIPCGPWVCDNAIADVVIVKVVEAVSALLSLPVATTVYPPAESEGTVKVQLNAPVDDVVWEVHV